MESLKSMREINGGNQMEKRKYLCTLARCVKGMYLAVKL